VPGPAPFAPPELVTAAGHRALVWRLPVPMLAVSSSPLGGGIGRRWWVLNVKVPLSYARHDVEEHLGEIADALGLRGPGIGFLTAAPIAQWTTATEAPAVGDAAGADVRLDATVGVSVPTWAAADVREAPLTPRVGTINIVGRVGRRMTDAALVNAVATVTEAKVQAVLAAGVDGTGTASDAVCVLCPAGPDHDGLAGDSDHDDSAGGPAEAFGGPRSALGAPLARTTFAAVLAGVHRYRAVVDGDRDGDENGT
jgi:adenosylcobinamide hydrolase